MNPVYARTYLQSQKKHTQLSSAQRSATERSGAQSSAVRYRAVPCGAGLCRAVLCCAVFSLSYISKEVPGMYVCACGVRVVFLEHGALGICKSHVGT